jgi:hypothetical protein
MAAKPKHKRKKRRVRVQRRNFRGKGDGQRGMGGAGGLGEGRGRTKGTLLGRCPSPSKNDLKKVQSRRVCLAGKRNNVRQEMHGTVNYHR